MKQSTNASKNSEPEDLNLARLGQDGSEIPQFKGLCNRECAEINTLKSSVDTFGSD